MGHIRVGPLPGPLQHPLLETSNVRAASSLRNFNRRRRASDISFAYERLGSVPIIAAEASGHRADESADQE
jgi:hypothetical protein